MSTFAKAHVGSGATTLPQAHYVSDEVFAAERERIFAREWICVGREEQLGAAGDYFLAEVAGESLIVARDDASRLHAFFNVCRHRGTRICETHTGHFTGSIQCPYHAWTYGLDGALKVARNMAEVPGFSAGDYPLHEAAIATWDGFIFANLAKQPQPFEAAFAPLLTRFAAWGVAKLRTAKTISYDLQCNWKLVFQNYSECYHCPLVHPQLEKISPSDSGRNDLMEGPFLGGYSELKEDGAGLVNSADRKRVYYYTIFPSLLLSLHPDYVMVHYMHPLAPDRTRIDCAWLSSGSDVSEAVDFWDLTNRQDWHVNELTQAGVASRAYTPGPYANAEGLLAAFDRHYLKVMA